MKNILITGANSYIGLSFKKWLKQYTDKYYVSELDMTDNSWTATDFSPYDAIFHVAGIAHADIGNVSNNDKSAYYDVNCHLAVETAKKAKKEGVKLFVFMSSIIVYGNSGGIGQKKIITKDTIPVPDNFYGDSKLQAENGICKLTDHKFKAAILRPPMIYGKGSRGNYALLRKIACKSPFFPGIANERSMLYIDNLCEFVRLIIELDVGGIFYPQNKDYVETYNLVLIIEQMNGKTIHICNLFNRLIFLLGKSQLKAGTLVNKALENLVYEKNMSQYEDLKIDYQVFTLWESIKLTETS